MFRHYISISENILIFLSELGLKDLQDQASLIGFV